jgi:hypothetical protein
MGKCGPKPQGGAALTPAERQACYRGRRFQPRGGPRRGGAVDD